MAQKQHNDPLIYRAYGTLKGIYKPSKADPTTGTLTTDDGERFPAVLSGEVAELFRESNPEVEQLKQQCLWKCNFRTRPVTVQLKKAKITKVDKNQQHSFRANRFQVDGQLLKVNKTTVSVLIKANEGEKKPFILMLNGKFNEDKSYPFWRFKLIRKGRIFQIVWVKKLGLPEPQEKAPSPKKKKAKQPDKL